MNIQSEDALKHGNSGALVFEAGKVRFRRESLAEGDGLELHSHEGGVEEGLEGAEILLHSGG